MSVTPYMSCAEVRKNFIDFFISKNHKFIKSSPVIPFDDKTLLFTNAGMNQFKPIFLGTVDPTTDLGKLKAACNSQKCIRAGGKHNDLDDVGKDGTHHTFFEMLGNWSFGDYFKKEAIQWSFELLTQVYKLDKDRIYASYFGGDDKLGLKPDLEAKEIWEQYLSPDRVLPFGAKENFWEMGDTGPCGPCSEIHYDFVGNRNAADLVNKDDPTVIEIWNNVFIQFNREKDGSLSVLPDKHVDTGMGFERISSIIQGVRSNYDTDIFKPIFEEIQKVTGYSQPYGGKMKKDDVDGVDTAYRVIADHIRCLTVAITDGGVPSNEGRGYVLRRIIRRAVTYGHKYLKAKVGFFHKLVPVVSQTLGDFFTELKTDIDNVSTIIRDEEISFSRTLANGIKEFEKVAEASKTTGVISGKDAFTLYATFGFPKEETFLMALERGLSVDMKGYDEEHKKHIEDSKKTVGKETVMSVELGPDDIKSLIGICDEKKYNKPSEFSYEWKNIESKVVGIIQNKIFYQSTEKVESGKPIGIVLEKTTFYAESGGQIYDIGVLKGSSGEFVVHNVQTYAGFIVHTGLVKEGKIEADTIVETQVDFDRRRPVAANHTSTHMLNFGLASSLKDKVQQRGSLVTPDRLRFDFSYGKGLTPQELIAVQDVVRGLIKKDLPVNTELLELETAYKVPGVCALFGEQYPNPVRVVSVGETASKLTETNKLSVEFCGGTHMSKTSEAGDFVIISEQSISKGTRRIIAVTQDVAKRALANATQFQKSINACKELKGEEFVQNINSLQIELDHADTFIPITSKFEFKNELDKLFDLSKKYQKEIEKELKNKLFVWCDQLISKGSSVIVENLGQYSKCDRKILVEGLEYIEKKLPESVAMFVSVEPSKLMIYANVPKSRLNKIKAGEWVGEVCKVSGGKGGGKDNSASGQGADVTKAEDSIKFAIEYAKNKLQ